jgi:hypothetical protein
MHEVPIGGQFGKDMGRYALEVARRNNIVFKDGQRVTARCLFPQFNMRQCAAERARAVGNVLSNVAGANKGHPVKLASVDRGHPDDVLQVRVPLSETGQPILTAVQIDKMGLG